MWKERCASSSPGWANFPHHFPYKYMLIRSTFPAVGCFYTPLCKKRDIWGAHGVPQPPPFLSLPVCLSCRLLWTALTQTESLLSARVTCDHCATSLSAGAVSTDCSLTQTGLVVSRCLWCSIVSLGVLVYPWKQSVSRVCVHACLCLWLPVLN